jgi:hypothetical protein
MSSLRQRRTSVIDEAMLEYDTEERTLLIQELEKAVTRFLGQEATHFRGWTLSKVEADSTHVFFHLTSPDGIDQDITSNHFMEVKTYLSQFNLNLPVHNAMNGPTRSAKITQQCYLDYDIERGNRLFSRKRFKKIFLWILLIFSFILFVILLTTFLKHTEHDSSRLGPLWKLWGF